MQHLWPRPPEWEALGIQLQSEATPDYLIEGKVFDAYEVNTNNLVTVGDEIGRKARRGYRTIVYLGDKTNLTYQQLRDYLLRDRVPPVDINELWIVDRDGTLRKLDPENQQEC